MEGTTVLHSMKDVGRFLDYVIKQGEGVFPLAVSYKPYRQTRSLSANALYWVWLDQLAKHFSGRGYGVDKEKMHLLMKHKFLGYTAAVLIGITEIKPQLRSTRSLDREQMCDYMMAIDSWAIQHDCLLPRPAGCDYDHYLKSAS